jgi:hypothetical protein
VHHTDLDAVGVSVAIGQQHGRLAFAVLVTRVGLVDADKERFTRVEDANAVALSVARVAVEVCLALSDRRVAHRICVALDLRLAVALGISSSVVYTDTIDGVRSRRSEHCRRCCG